MSSRRPDQEPLRIAAYRIPELGYRIEDHTVAIGCRPTAKGVFVPPVGLLPTIEWLNIWAFVNGKFASDREELEVEAMLLRRNVILASASSGLKYTPRRLIASRPCTESYMAIKRWLCSAMHFCLRLKVLLIAEVNLVGLWCKQWCEMRERLPQVVNYLSDGIPRLLVGIFVFCGVCLAIWCYCKLQLTFGKLIKLKES